MSNAETRIGAVVDLISSIAGQTNLLALNATIEAARAAMQVAASLWSPARSRPWPDRKATIEIRQQISGIQSATQESVAKEIGDTILVLFEISSTIAAAVEQQGARIARNVQQAAMSANFWKP